MIIETEADLKVLRAFCDHAFRHFSVTGLSEKTGISKNWVYRITNKLERYKLLEKSGKSYKLDFSSQLCKRLKLLFDAEYVELLDRPTKEAVTNAAGRMDYELQPLSIVLVGSVATAGQTPKSDLDFLVIVHDGDKKRPIPKLENCNVAVFSENEIKDKYLKGDDFVISALSFGKVLLDNKGAFMNFFENPLPVFSSELIQEKIRYCETLEERVYSLLKMGDEDRAREELLYLVLQAARIVLLRNRTIPGTKSDIAGQVGPFNKELARALKILLSGPRKLKKAEILEYAELGMKAIR